MTATLSKVERPGTEHTDQTNHDQIDGHDEVQKFGHDQNKNPGHERNQGGQTEMKVHVISNSNKKNVLTIE